MARLESLRDRLPELYRPDADDAVSPPIPLRRDDLAEVRGDPGTIGFTSTKRDDSLVVQLKTPDPVRALALTPGRAPGAGYALELYALEGGGALALRPFAVLTVLDGVAPVDVALPSAFAMQLKQRSLLTQQLLAVAGVLDRLNREAGDVMQSHWFDYADRAVNNPFFLRSRALIYLSGLLLMTAGMALVLTHNVWVARWPVLITILGWLAAIGGAVRIIAPQGTEKIGRAVLKGPRGLQIAGAVWLAIGALLCFFGYVR